MSSWPVGKRGCTGILTGLILLVAAVVSLWYGMNSDRDDIHPLLTQLIPAGHCACKTATRFDCASCLTLQTHVDGKKAHSGWTFQYDRDGKDLTLTEPQCQAAFPGLFEDVEYGKKAWNQSRITHETLDKYKLVDGTARAMIYGGNLYVIATKAKGEDHRRKLLAALSSMYRALASSPERKEIADVEFIFSIEDKGEDIGASGHPIWALARKATETLWLMPDFGYWAWDNIIGDSNNQIGAYDEVVERAVELEEDLRFDQKRSKLVWRGKLSFAPKLRRALLEQARGYEWNNVKEINWEVKNNYLTLDDHCKYKFIAHAEGV